MYPITITLHTDEQLDAVTAALRGLKSSGCSGKCESKTPPEKTKTETVKADTTKKSEPVVTKSADTQSTAAGTDAQEKKAEDSGVYVMTPDERNVVVRKAIAAKGRDAVVALLAEYGVAKASEIEDKAKLAEFDVRLNKLAA